jgi:hypothetical protein
LANAAKIIAPLTLQPQKPPRLPEVGRSQTEIGVAIVNGAVIETTEHGERKTLFTDVFAYRDGKWQAVSAQELPVTGP